MAILHNGDSDCQNQAQQKLLARYHGAAQLYTLPEARRLSDEIIAGNVQLLLCSNLKLLIQCLWECQIQVDMWRGRGLHIELIDSPFPPGTDIWPVLLDATDAWLAAQRAARRRRIIAGLILSLIAVAACAALMYLLPR